MKRIMIAIVAPMLAAGCMSHYSGRVAQTAPCPTPSAHALQAVDDLKRILADSNGVMTEYRAALGIDGVAPSSVAGVRDARTCTAVTAAVAEYLRRDPSAENMFVLRVGSRYVAMDASRDPAPQFVVSRKLEVTNYLEP